jgi:hypothetical protein
MIGEQKTAVVMGSGFESDWPGDNFSSIVADTPVGQAGTPADTAGTVL